MKKIIKTSKAPLPVGPYNQKPPKKEEQGRLILKINKDLKCHQSHNVMKPEALVGMDISKKVIRKKAIKWSPIV